MNSNPYRRAFFAKAYADMRFVAARTQASEGEVKLMEAAMRMFSTRAAKCYASIAASFRRDDERGVLDHAEDGMGRQALQLLRGPCSSKFRRECGKLLVAALNKREAKK